MSSIATIPAEEGSPSRRNGVPIAFLTGFFFSFRTIVVLCAVRVFGATANEGSAAYILLDALLLLVVSIHGMGRQRRSLRSLLELASVRWVFAFLLVSFSSFLWSETVSLATSLAYWFGLAADVLIVTTLVRTESAEDVASGVMRGFVWSTCCLAILAWVMPGQTDLRLGDEIFFNTNQIGNLCAISIFFAQYLSRRKEGNWKLPIAFLAITLIRSLSKTTLAAFIVSEGLLLILDRSISRRTKLLAVAGFLLVGAAFWGLLETYYQNYISGGDSVTSLTGRTGIWAYVTTEIPEKPWLGHGFDSMWKVIPPFGPDQFEARHAENELLQQVYAYGAAGFILLVGIYVSLYRTIRKLSDKPIRILFLCFLVFMLVRGLAEAEPFDLLLPLWCVVLLAALVSSQDTAVEAPFESGADVLAGEIA